MPSGGSGSRFEADIPVEGLDGGPFHAVFIRGPVVNEVEGRSEGVKPHRPGDRCRGKGKAHGPCLPPGARRRPPAPRAVYQEPLCLIPPFHYFSRQPYRSCPRNSPAFGNVPAVSARILSGLPILKASTTRTIKETGRRHLPPGYARSLCSGSSSRRAA